MATIELHVNELEEVTTAYPESERVLRIITSNVMDEIYAKVDLDMDGNLPEDLESEIVYALNRRFGRNVVAYRGYEDVTEDGEE